MLGLQASFLSIFKAESWHTRLRVTLQISYYSKTLTLTEHNFSTYDKEIFSIIASCKHFRPYI